MVRCNALYTLLATVFNAKKMITNEKIIESQIDKASEMDGTYTGMTYEQGIKDALEWILFGEIEEPPLE